MVEDQAPLRLIRLREVLSRVPYSRSHIYRLEKQGKFPKRVKFGPGRVAWIEKEVEEYLLAFVTERTNDVCDARHENSAPDMDGGRPDDLLHPVTRAKKSVIR